MGRCPSSTVWASSNFSAWSLVISAGTWSRRKKRAPAPQRMTAPRAIAVQERRRAGRSTLRRRKRASQPGSAPAPDGWPDGAPSRCQQAARPRATASTQEVTPRGVNWFPCRTRAPAPWHSTASSRGPRGASVPPLAKKLTAPITRAPAARGQRTPAPFAAPLPESLASLLRDWSPRLGGGPAVRAGGARRGLPVPGSVRFEGAGRSRSAGRLRGQRDPGQEEGHRAGVH